MQFTAAYPPYTAAEATPERCRDYCAQNPTYRFAAVAKSGSC
jgi:hypothetical protein